MSLPDATTTIRNTRPALSEDPTEAPGPATIIATGVRAHFSSPSTASRRGAVASEGEGGRQVSTWSLFADPLDLRDGDTVVDEGDGRTYAVDWAVSRDDDGVLDHVRASVTLLAPLNNG